MHLCFLLAACSAILCGMLRMRPEPDATSTICRGKPHVGPASLLHRSTLVACSEHVSMQARKYSLNISVGGVVRKQDIQLHVMLSSYVVVPASVGDNLQACIDACCERASRLQRECIVPLRRTHQFDLRPRRERLIALWMDVQFRLHMTWPLFSAIFCKAPRLFSSLQDASIVCSIHSKRS